MIFEGELYEDERDFLDRCGVSFLDLYDARGMTKGQYKPKAKASFCHFVLGNVSVCGHRLKTRNGHCIQCSPERVSMQMGGDSESIYAAIAPELGLIKVGRSHDPARRMEQLNLVKYGGSTSWQLVFAKEVAMAKEIESALHRQLYRFRRQGTQTRDGNLQWATELFQCSEQTVRSAYIRALEDVVAD